MSTLELECPGCEQLLELDAGFAGGVCRCSNCGTLMTVPVEAGEAVETVQRHERPAQPDRPDSPTTSAGPERPARRASPNDPEPEPAARELTPDEQGGAEAPPATSAKAAGESADAGQQRAGEQVFTTASGRQVHVSGAGSIPTARKKKRWIVRAATALVLAGVLLAVLAMSAAGVWMLSTAQQEAAVQPVMETFEYDRRINPYQHPLANVLGMPVAERAAVVVDASSASQPWLVAMNHALRDGLLETNSASAVGLVYANEQGLHVHPGRPSQLVHWRERDLMAFHAGIASAGDAALGEAVARAMQWEPKQVIVITGRDPADDELATMRDALGPRDAVSVDVVMIDHDAAVLDDLTYAYGGRYARLTLSQLDQWRAVTGEALDEDEAAEAP